MTAECRLSCCRLLFQITPIRQEMENVVLSISVRAYRTMCKEIEAVLACRLDANPTTHDTYTHGFRGCCVLNAF